VQEGKELTPEEAELKAAFDAILLSTARKKLIVAGPGTGKTTLFKEILRRATGEPDHRIVLTFINNLKNDLERDLANLAKVHTLHSFCLGLLYREAALRTGLTPDFICCPGLASLIAHDWEIINGSESPKFVGEMRELSEDNHIPFYLERGNYYDAVDFDDTVYRAYSGLTSGFTQPGKYDLVMIDEYQDFNRLEAGIVDIFGETNPIMIAGDDDQALYSQLRDASSNYIRSLKNGGEYEVFELPFCMRCPKVIVDSVNDILSKARLNHKLEGRIEKLYKYFPPVKGVDSTKYPKINLVETSVQSKKVNYMGRYIAQEISLIAQEEIESAGQGGYPTVLVIVAKPYRGQIIDYLKSAGFEVETRSESDNNLNREVALSILKQNPDSNLGWRIILENDKRELLHNVILVTADGSKKLENEVPVDFRNAILAEVLAYNPPEEEVGTEETEQTPPGILRPMVRVTSFEGSKGMSAQHVFIAGLHNGELPHDPREIKDLEICKFVVGLTRTRKKCTLIYTRHFDKTWKDPSKLISWINVERLNFIKVNKAYWERQAK
jgi:superfamily I DNA/RNA helicase